MGTLGSYYIDLTKAERIAVRLYVESKLKERTSRGHTRDVQFHLANAVSSLNDKGIEIEGVTLTRTKDVKPTYEDYDVDFQIDKIQVRTTAWEGGLYDILRPEIAAISIDLQMGTRGTKVILTQVLQKRDGRLEERVAWKQKAPWGRGG